MALAMVCTHTHTHVTTNMCACKYINTDTEYVLLFTTVATKVTKTKEIPKLNEYPSIMMSMNYVLCAMLSTNDDPVMSGVSAGISM